MLTKANFLVILLTLSFINATLASSYYDETFNTIRRFIVPRNTDVLFNFTVILDKEDQLAEYEQLAIVGDHEKLGSWSADNAILLNRTAMFNEWYGSVSLLQNTTVQYRYFIAAQHRATNSIQIRRWESSLHARTVVVGTKSENHTDNFGWTPQSNAREIQRGWLNSGKIVQFKLFRNPITFNEPLAEGQQIRLQLQAIEPEKLTKILPSATANTEYVRMQYGNSYLRTQPEYGVPFENNDILMFHTTVAEFERVEYVLKVYSSHKDEDLVRLIGYQYILPAALQGSEGNFSVPLISPMWFNSIGTLHLQYVIISPLASWANVKPAFDFQTTFVEYWRDNWTSMDLGHRGLGKSLKQATNAAPLIENTVASMKASGELGAEFVEFDVMLTSDYVPIISHDYYVNVCLDDKTPTSKDDLTEVLIKDLTYEQLKNLKTYQVVSNKVVEYPAHNTVELEDNRLFPLFADFLSKVDKNVGFDIEIKWPQRKFNGDMESIQTIDKNLYVDRILEVMYEHGCGRLSFFTSFDADICSMLRYKQNMYPVMLLSSSKESNFADPRTDTIYDSVNTAQAFDLAGIVPNAVFISQRPDWIQVALRQNKKVFLWGDTIKDAESIAWFKAQGPTGVIYDRLDLWLPENKKSIFELESDLPGFFQLQCPPRNETESSLWDFY